MTLQKIQVTSDKIITIKISDPTALIVCKVIKSDTRVCFSVSLDQENWVDIEPTRDRYLHLNPKLYYQVTLKEGARQQYPIYLQFLGEVIIEEKIVEEEEGKKVDPMVEVKQKAKEHLKKINAPITRPAKAERISALPPIGKAKNESNTEDKKDTP